METYQPAHQMQVQRVSGVLGKHRPSGNRFLCGVFRFKHVCSIKNKEDIWRYAILIWTLVISRSFCSSTMFKLIFKNPRLDFFVDPLIFSPFPRASETHPFGTFKLGGLKVWAAELTVVLLTTRNPARKPVEGKVVYPIIYRVFHIPGGCLVFSINSST